MMIFTVTVRVTVTGTVALRSARPECPARGRRRPAPPLAAPGAAGPKGSDRRESVTAPGLTRPTPTSL